MPSAHGAHKRAANTTALAITWQGADAKGSLAPDVISTQMLPENEVSSTITAGQPIPAGAAAGADAFDEDEIEKAIAEIREAIEKSSQLLK